MNKKTLILTSIYSNLWGTEFGGRPSREYHYKVSLLNILNLNPTKVVCFTSEEEINGLRHFFYNEKGISESVIEFIVFDLTHTRYFDKINSIKDMEFMKTFDRCYEIQYNKLFWIDSISNLDEYEKVYWFDAGLSHGGLFPEEFSFGNGFETNFQFNLFNENFINYLNKISDKKFILVGKTNQEKFYWSTTIPENYYYNYQKNIHIVGGFFGGNVETYKKVVKLFDDLLVNLLVSENSLFVEEQILSAIYYNNSDLFKVLLFDDWYHRGNHDDNVKYFYNVFIETNIEENFNYNEQNYETDKQTQEIIETNPNILLEDQQNLESLIRQLINEILIEKGLVNISNTKTKILNKNNIDYPTMIDFVSIINETDKKIKGVIHIGAYDCLEKPKYDSLSVGKTIWIEANPDYEEMIRNKVGDDIVIISGIGNENNSKYFNIANNGQSSSFLEFGTHLEEHPGINFVGQIEINMKRMVNIIEDYNIDIDSYNFLNIDVQGYELEVMKSFDNLIDKFDFIYCEVNEKELYLNCPLISDLDLYLDKFNFERIGTFMTHHGWGDALYKKNKKK